MSDTRSMIFGTVTLVPNEPPQYVNPVALVPSTHLADFWEALANDVGVAPHPGQMYEVRDIDERVVYYNFCENGRTWIGFSTFPAT